MAETIALGFDGKRKGPGRLMRRARRGGPAMTVPMRDDRLTGYATENVAPLTPPDIELLGSLTRQLPRIPYGQPERLGDVVTELSCPIRDCPGYEGPHGALNAETWTSAGAATPGHGRPRDHAALRRHLAGQSYLDHQPIAPVPSASEGQDQRIPYSRGA